MSVRRAPDRRRLAIAAVAAVAVAALVVILARGDRPTGDGDAAATASAPLSGTPVLAVEMPAGVTGSGPTVSASDRAVLDQATRRTGATGDLFLARGAAELAARDVRAAGASFERAAALGDDRATIALAFTTWDARQPDRTIELIRAAERRNPSAFAQYHEAVAVLWAGRAAEAQDLLLALRDREAEPSFYRTKADDLLHPGYEAGYPSFVPQTARTTSIADLVERAKARPDDVATLRELGTVLLVGGRRADAATAFRRALALDPEDIETRVALAVATFDKDDPSASIGQIGPLVRDRPRDPLPRFHLGVLLGWIGERDLARSEFRQVVESDPGGRYAVFAREAMDSLGG